MHGSADEPASSAPSEVNGSGRPTAAVGRRGEPRGEAGRAEAMRARVAASASGLATPEERGGDIIALRMPFSEQPHASREYTLESVLTVNEFKAIATNKATVCTSVFDVLRRLEISKRVEAEDMESVDNMVRHVLVYDLQQLETRSCRALSLAERTKKGGVYDKMRAKLSLEGCHLVSFGVSKNGHFCEATWLPQSADLKPHPLRFVCALQSRRGGRGGDQAVPRALRNA